ncbi:MULTISPECIES: hypothetical protein [Gordonia]|uniref:Uncharacterized protein n=1 Tax=Gordonia amicalis TaxID=89053 RepID=A0AAE4R298_9ACTN|nr:MULTISPECIES: hypothetical protein [Gordonia]ATD71622.1 hypothetical protein CNO18_16500 [Gordonia sp. 1D]KAF0969202.1 hypothetical protein BPODLACK_02435 [Gordonia sp. YY1]MBA5846762.1 hypothetical protein [Gordonia amicalis]MCR8898845.1 hypothetical protein [Gordonia sp. GONU]MCZ0913944.1 hypothetical protein [Gordonia amicalis]
MATLLTSDEFDLRLLFAEPVAEVKKFLREVVDKREPIALEVEGTAHFLNLGNVKHFTLVDQDPGDESLGTDDGKTVVLAISEVRG